MRFTKMHGAGNDYVFVDCFSETTPSDPSRLAVAIADRHTGVGSDGLILIEPSAHADAAMRTFNADGSEAEMCGNGIRCVAKYLFDHAVCRKSILRIETIARVHTVEVFTDSGMVDRVRVDMGSPVLDASRIPTTVDGNHESGDRVVDAPFAIAGWQLHVTCVSMGNPHCVIFVEDVTDELVLGLGPLIENDARFPDRVNVEFVKVISPNELRQRTWERGSGETLACGTGASAVCVAGVLSGRTERSVVNQLPGGTFVLKWNEANGHVLLTGPAVEVFSGDWLHEV